MKKVTDLHIPALDTQLYMWIMDPLRNRNMQAVEACMELSICSTRFRDTSRTMLMEELPHRLFCRSVVVPYKFFFLNVHILPCCVLFSSVIFAFQVEFLGSILIVICYVFGYFCRGRI